MGNWWMLIPALVLCAVPYFVIDRPRWWPGAFGWALCIFSVGLMAASGFRDVAIVGFALLFFGVVLGFAGSLNGPNSPAN
jgi:hypothetical protein